LAGTVDPNELAAFKFVEIGQCWHPAATSELGASDETVIGDAGGDDDLLRVSRAYLPISIVQNLKVRPILSHGIFSMRHKLHSHSPKLIQLIIALPASEGFLYLPIGLEMPEGKEVFFDPNERKLLDVIIDLLPHSLCIDPKFEEPSILQADEQFKVIFVIGIFMQFFDLAQREVDESIAQFQHDLIVTQDEGDLLILTVDGLGTHEFTVDQYRNFTFDYLVFFYSEILPVLTRLHPLVSS
jgi:hypothetical protein